LKRFLGSLQILQPSNLIALAACVISALAYYGAEADGARADKLLEAAVVQANAAASQAMTAQRQVSIGERQARSADALVRAGEAQARAQELLVMVQRSTGSVQTEMAKQAASIQAPAFSLHSFRIENVLAEDQTNTRISWQLQNVGGSAASVVDDRWILNIGPKLTARVVWSEVPRTNGGVVNVSPQGTYGTLKAAALEFTPEQRRDLKAGTSSVFFFERIMYRDVRARMYTQCLVARGVLDGESITFAAPIEVNVEGCPRRSG
jgi:hypothetical protein